MATTFPIGLDAEIVVARKHRRRFGSNMPLKAKVGAVIVGFFVLLAIFGPFVAPYNPSAQAFPSLQGPTFQHWLGTTSQGEDILSQFLVGVRATLLLGVITGLVATSLSVIVGVISGFVGGVVDEFLSLFSNVFLVIPALPLLLVLFSYLHSTSTVVMALVLSALGWPWGARVIRAQTLSIRSRDFVAAAREVGERRWRIIFFEVMPHLASLITASFIFTVLYAVGASVGLLFLGIGGTSTWSLGTMLYWAQNASASTNGDWAWFLAPGLAVAIFGMGLVLLNFGIDEIGNPRLRDASHQRRIGGHPWRPADPTPVLWHEGMAWTPDAPSATVNTVVNDWSSK